MIRTMVSEASLNLQFFFVHVSSFNVSNIHVNEVLKKNNQINIVRYFKLI